MMPTCVAASRGDDTMGQIYVKRFSEPDEVRPFSAHGKLAFLKFGDRGVGMGTFEPGWKWSQDVQPIAGTASCQTSHSCYVLTGRMRVVMDDGQSLDLTPGDVALIPPGHDAWTVGTEACRLVDFGEIGSYAVARASPGARPEAALRSEARH